MTAASKSKDRPPAPQLGQTHERENRRLGVQCQRDAACAGVEGGAPDPLSSRGESFEVQLRNLGKSDVNIFF